MAEVAQAVYIRVEHWNQIQSHTSSLAPEEACGLVAGQNRVSTRVYPVENELHSPVRFRMEGNGQARAMFEIDEQGWEILAIYHSHPKGPPHPSPTDVAEAYYPESANLIWYLEDGIWKCKAFTIIGHEVQEIPLLIEDMSNDAER